VSVLFTSFQCALIGEFSPYVFGFTFLYSQSNCPNGPFAKEVKSRQLKYYSFFCCCRRRRCCRCRRCRRRHCRRHCRRRRCRCRRRYCCRRRRGEGLYLLLLLCLPSPCAIKVLRVY
jgi:hypothetical protein